MEVGRRRERGEATQRSASIRRPPAPRDSVHAPNSQPSPHPPSPLPPYPSAPIVLQQRALSGLGCLPRPLLPLLSPPRVLRLEPALRLSRRSAPLLKLLLPASPVTPHAQTSLHQASSSRLCTSTANLSYSFKSPFHSAASHFPSAVTTCVALALGRCVRQP